MSWFSRVFFNKQINFLALFIAKFHGGTERKRGTAGRHSQQNSASLRTTACRRFFAAPFVAAFLLLTFAGQAAAQQTIFSDGNFTPSAWTETILSPPTNNPANSVTVTTVATGGVPAWGAWRQTQQNYFALPDNPNEARTRIFVAHMKVNAVYDPALGKITYIDYSADTGKFSAQHNDNDGNFVSSINGCDGYRFLLLQGGTYYRDTENQNPCSEDFSNYSYTHDVSQDVFERVPEDGPGPEQPDFSCNGSPIQFGYLTANQSGDADQTNLQTISGIDNWRVDLKTERCPPKVVKLDINKIFDNSNGNMPSFGAASFNFDISGCNSTPSSVTLTSSNSNASVSANVGETCTVTEQPPTGVTLLSYCRWQTTYNPGQQLQIAAGGNGVQVINKVSCDPPPFSTEHFQCYFVEQETPFKPVRSPDVVLDDQFGRTENTVLRPRLICAPVDKDGEGMENEIDHLVFYELKESIPVNKLVEVENQFGTQRLRVLNSVLLGVPSIKTVMDEKPPVLEIDKEAVSGTCISGQPCEFTVTITNSGGPFTGNLEILDETVPNNVELLSTTPSVTGCSVGDTTPFTCLTGPISIPAGGSVTYTYSLAAPGPYSFPLSKFENCVELSDDMGNFIDKDCVRVGVISEEPEEKIDLGISKELLDGPAQNGEKSEFEITVTNNGDPISSPPNTITVTDILPQGFEFVGSFPPWPWVCPAPSGQAVVTCTWAGGPIGSGGLPVFSIWAEVKGSKGGQQCVQVGITDINGVSHDADSVNDNFCLDVNIGSNSVEPGGGGTLPDAFACVSGLRSAGSNLNMRDDPSGNAKIILEMPQGTPLIVLGRQGGWSKVQIVVNGNSGPTGWVATKFTSEVDSPVQCVRSIQQEEPQQEEPQREPTVPTTDAGDILPTGGGELINELIDNVLPKTDAPPVVDTPPPDKGFTCEADLPVFGSVLILRAEPSCDARVTEKLTQGTAVIMLERQGEWSRVQVVAGARPGQAGWATAGAIDEVKRKSVIRTLP